MKSYGFIKDGKLSPGLKQLMVTAIGIMEGKNVVIDITEQKGKGSPQTHGYYRGYILPTFHDLFKEGGNNWNIKRTHDLLKSMFMQKEEVDVSTGEAIPYTPSSADFTQEDWGYFINCLKEKYFDYTGTHLKEPNERLELL